VVSSLVSEPVQNNAEGGVGALLSAALCEHRRRNMLLQRHVLGDRPRASLEESTRAFGAGLAVGESVIKCRYSSDRAQ
jgi:hypothetical protein